MGRNHYNLTRHAALRVVERFPHLSVTEKDFNTAIMSWKVPLFDGPNGRYVLVRLRNRLLVLVMKSRDIVTVLTVEDAYADCPKAVFYSLVAIGDVRRAVSLRSRPTPVGLGEQSAFKFPRTKANAVWGAFSWAAKSL